MKRFAKLSAVLAVATIVWLSAPVMAMGTPPQPESLRLAAYEGDVGALEWIAQEKGFFDKLGLQVEIKGFASGKDALEALKAGRVDVATASEFVFASASLADTQLRILGNISHYRNKAVIGRVDRGIKVPADLKGKRVGVTMPSGAEYSLHVFLALENLTMRQITPVGLGPKEIVESLVAGSIDAAITWQPHVQSAERRLGKLGITFPGDSYDIFLLLLADQHVAVAREGAIRKLLAGLLLAEDWVAAHPDEAKRFIAARFKLDEAYVASLWPQMRLTVDFPQELMTAIDGEASWLVKRNGAAGTAIPNYANFILPGPLRSLRPRAVSVLSR